MVRFSGSLDANVVLRLLLNDIPDQHETAKKLVSSSTCQLAVSDVALIEVAFVLERHYGFNRTQIKEVFGDFMNLRQINCNRVLFDEALPMFEQYTALSLEDCALATYAKLNNATPLYTFDKKLAAKSPNAKLLA